MGIPEFIGFMQRAGAAPELVTKVVCLIEEEKRAKERARRAKSFRLKKSLSEKDGKNVQKRPQTRSVPAKVLILHESLSEKNGTRAISHIEDNTLPFVPRVPPLDAKLKKGTRLPADWKLDDLAMAEARKIGLSEQAARFEADKFRDYWVARAGAGGCKLDWLATWRNWCRNSRAAPPPPKPVPKETYHHPVTGLLVEVFA